MTLAALAVIGTTVVAVLATIAEPVTLGTTAVAVAVPSTPVARQAMATQA